MCVARNASRDDDVVADDDDGDNCVMTAAAYERAWQCRQQQHAHMPSVCVCRAHAVMRSELPLTGPHPPAAAKLCVCVSRVPIQV